MTKEKIEVEYLENILVLLLCEFKRQEKKALFSKQLDFFALAENYFQKINKNNGKISVPTSRWRYALKKLAEGGCLKEGYQDGLYNYKLTNKGIDRAEKSLKLITIDEEKTIIQESEDDLMNESEEKCLETLENINSKKESVNEKLAELFFLHIEEHVALVEVLKEIVLGIKAINIGLERLGHGQQKTNNNLAGISFDIKGLKEIQNGSEAIRQEMLSILKNEEEAQSEGHGTT